MEYREILSEIAKTQRVLLTYSLDWESRTLIMIPETVRYGLFGLRRKLSQEALEKQVLLEKLEKLKREAEAYIKNTSTDKSYYWWKIPWEQLERYLLINLAEPTENGAWRFETKWESVKRDDVYDLLFYEEGHFSDFSGSSAMEFFETSKYSAAERSELMKRYADSQKKSDRDAWYWYHGKSIYSMDTGKLYDSIDSYLLSAEHYLDKQYQKEKFQKSLSTEHQLNRVEVTSRSLHYCCTYYMGKFHISEKGHLDGFDLKPYLLEEWNGDLPVELKEYRQRKDARVASMAHLADLPEVVLIPADLFGEAVWEGVSSENEALFYAELIISVAKKIRFDVPLVLE